MSTKRNTAGRERQSAGVVDGTDASRVKGRTESITVADYVALASKERSPRKLKYNNTPCVVDSIRFDSRREALRYQDLKIAERCGLINDLKLQVSYPLKVNGVLVATYRSDFDYTEDGKKIVEDTKSEYTRKLMWYRMKKKLMLAIYGIEIRET